MAKERNFVVTLYPAERERGYFVTKFDFGQDLPKKAFQAVSTEQAVAEARAFAVAHGKPCHASIRIVKGRKPAGFDRQTRSLYFNMETPQTT